MAFSFLRIIPRESKILIDLKLSSLYSIVRIPDTGLGKILIPISLKIKIDKSNLTEGEIHLQHFSNTIYLLTVSPGKKVC